MESCLENSQDAYEGNKDAARASFRVKQKLDGYEEGEMRSLQGQVIDIVLQIISKLVYIPLSHINLDFDTLCLKNLVIFIRNRVIV